MKRQRTNSAPARRAKRPIDKTLRNVSYTAIGSVQKETELYPPATFPGTITGLRWDIAICRDGGTAPNRGFIKWAIVVVPQGQNGANTIASSDTSTLYNPEQNVLAFGSFVSTTSPTNAQPLLVTGSTKSMRKLKAGDKLSFIAIGSATETHSLVGTVQFFIKT